MMARQLFLHHYLASIYFGILMIGQTFELLLSIVKPAKLARAAIFVYFAVVLGWFAWFSPLIYGTRWTKDLCERSSFFDMDFDCNLFYESLEPYTQQAVELKESSYSAYHGLIAPTGSSEEGENVEVQEEN